MRTFIAIELEPAVRRPLVRLLQQDVPRHPDVRWCAEPQLHVTLKFLGEVADDRLPEICRAAHDASRRVDPFELRLGDLGCFPSPRNPRVLWCGVDDPAGGCRRWVERADPLLDALGFKPETRAFTPHVTLGRSRSTAGGRVLQDVLDAARPLQGETMMVRDVVVFESRLMPRGAQYTPLARVPLGAAGA